jgi:succinyl-diaminopimelate desuccinylase
VIGRRTSGSKTPTFVTVDGVTREKTIHFNGHTDVVPAGDLSTWTHDPFGGEVVDGVMYGRGVSDMKVGCFYVRITIARSSKPRAGR